MGITTEDRLRRRVQALKEDLQQSESQAVAYQSGLEASIATLQQQLEEARNEVKRLTEDRVVKQESLIKHLEHMTPMEWSFFMAIIDNPEEDSVIHIFADWLIDQRREAQAKRLREVVEAKP